jgi:DNA-binding NtrC family response regulator
MERYLLLLDQDHDYLDWAANKLAADGIRVLKCDDAEKALKVIEKVDVEIAIVDIQMPTVNGGNGLDVLKEIKAQAKNWSDMLFIVTASFPTAAQLIDATQLGAHDILKKESLTFELKKIVEDAWQIIDARKMVEESLPNNNLATKDNDVIGSSKAFQDLFKLVGKVAQTDAPVLVTGESGTGKELVATSVHKYSSRCREEMIALNCGAIPDNLLESELFGHEKGSFTGAGSKRIGRFEQCNNGTLFLDEIGDMPLSVQVKLLRVLQEGTYSRVGGNEVLRTDVRIVAATNKNLANEVAEGRFREDLYYRLNVVELHIPPLRERVDDIPQLAEFFLKKIVKRQGTIAGKGSNIRISDEAISKLCDQPWPGNIRELENTIARACALAGSDVLLPDDIVLAESTRRPIVSTISPADVQRIMSQAPKDENVLTWLSRKLIDESLSASGGDMAKAAKKLNMSESEMQQMMAAS